MSVYLRRQAVDIIGVPFDLGASCRGSRMGPDALRCAGLLTKLQAGGCDVTDLGDIRLPGTEAVVQTGLDELVGCQKAKYAQEVIKLNKRLCRKVEASHINRRLPVIVGGDHSIAMGSIAGTAKQTSGKLGVIWFDAHGDLNTVKTTPSGNTHGMSLAVSLGYGLPALTRLGGVVPKVMPQHVVLIGARSLDPGEQKLIHETGIRVFSIREIDRIGMQEVAAQALEIVTAGTEGFHVSLDLDALDPAAAPGVGTPVAHGVRAEEAWVLMRAVHASGALRSADLVELNPALDLRSRTAKMGVELVCAMLGASAV